MIKHISIITLFVALPSAIHASDWKNMWSRMRAQSIHTVRAELDELQKEHTQIQNDMLTKPSEGAELLSLQVKGRFLKEEIRTFINTTSLRTLFHAKHGSFKIRLVND